MKAKIWLSAVLAACFIGCCGCGKGGGNDKMENWSEGKLTESDYAETYIPEDCALVNPPTAVHEVTSRATLDALNKGTWKPSNVVLRFSKNYNVLDEKGKKLDSFANVYRNILKGKMIPVLYLEDEACASAAVTFMTERIEISDLAVMSENAQAIRKVREAFPETRGILSRTKATSVTGLAADANEALAGTVLLSQKTATAENVNYIQARFKTVWVRAGSDTPADYRDCIGSGAYGVITSDFNKYYNAVSEYTKGVVRSPFNVGHRGLAATYHHNSISGLRAASENGATHVELDGWLSKDGHIVMMHNEDINATTNGSGKIPSMTLEEIRQYKLDKKGEPEEIPVLEDVADAMKEEGNNAVLIFEIKDGNPALVSELKRVIEEKQFEERIVVISFALNVIQEMAKELPRVPTALLRNTMTTDDIASCARYNTGIDVEAKNMTKAFENFAKDRGLMGWYWTFATAGAMGAAAKDGFVGLTSDQADKFTAMSGESSVAFVKPAENYAKADTVEEGDKIALRTVSYTGETTAAEGTVRFVADLGDRFAVMASFDGLEKAAFAPRFYSQIFYILKN